MSLRTRVDPLLLNLPPVAAAAICWMISPGSLLLIRHFFEGGMFLPFWAVRLGDAVGFPLFVACATMLVNKYGLGSRTWFNRWPLWVLLAIYILATTAGYLNWRKGIEKGTLPVSMQHSWSEKFHTWVIFGILTILLLQMIGAVLGSLVPRRKKALALSPLLLFFLGILLDTIFPNNR